MMRYLDLTLPKLGENLALDEALLLEAEGGAGAEVLRCWEWPRPAVVLGSGCVIADDVVEDACRADGIPVVRRSSGGGTVLLGPGCLLFSLVLSLDRSAELASIGRSYRDILGQVRRALEGLQPEMACVGTSDLAAAGRKFSGNAQQRKRHYLLHHGTLLYNFPIALIGQYLRPPRRQPEYRRQRDHEAFLINLPATGSELRDRLRSTWNATADLEDWPKEAVQQLTRAKYCRSEWIRRR
jgi:lipoate-protein ligase A